MPSNNNSVPCSTLLISILEPIKIVQVHYSNDKQEFETTEILSEYSLITDMFQGQTILF